MKKILVLSAIATVLFPFASSASPNLSDQTLKETQQAGSLYDQGGGLSVMQLIHNANLRGQTTPEQFQSRQKESLDEAIESFRKRNNTELKIDFSRQSN
jgi:hypothetical protein